MHFSLRLFKTLNTPTHQKQRWLLLTQNNDVDDGDEYADDKILKKKVAPSFSSSSAAEAGRQQFNPNQNSNKIKYFASLLKKPFLSLTHLKVIHAQILHSNLHHNISLSSLLFSLYSCTFALLPHSLSIISLLPTPNLSLFNFAIRVLAKSPPHSHMALSLYLRMTHLSIRPDNFSYPFLLNSCTSLSLVSSGNELHCRIFKCGFISYVHVGNALVHMYGKRGALVNSRKVFDEMLVRDVVSYNAVLGAYARGGEGMVCARRLFDGMEERNVITWNAMVVGYVNAGELGLAREMFDQMPVRNVVSWMVLITGYCKGCLLDDARELFETMPSKNMVLWSVMITGYTRSGRAAEALGLFREMERSGVTPDAATMTGIISAAAQLGGIELANYIWSYVDKKGIERNERVLTSLVDMHAKCGNVELALRLFEEIPCRDTFSYAALINGLASHGHGEKALEIFHQMRREAIMPDYVTFVGVLSACSHAGLIKEGLEFWESMVRDYGIERGPDHYACVVDMLSRAGRLVEAFEMTGRMPKGPHAGALGALLAGCKTFCNLDIAKSAAEQLFKLEPRNTGNYVLLSSIYASRGQWEEAARIRKLMKERCMRKHPGSSWF